MQGMTTDLASMSGFAPAVTAYQPVMRPLHVRPGKGQLHFTDQKVAKPVD